MNPTLSFYDGKISTDIDDLTMEKSTNIIGQCRIVHIFWEAQIILRKEKCSSGLEQSTPITIVLSHEIHVEVPACLITDVGDVIFQSLERVPVFRQPRLPPSPLSLPTLPLRLCNIRVVPRDLGSSPHSFHFQWRVTIQDTAETRIVVTYKRIQIRGRRRSVPRTFV